MRSEAKPIKNSIDPKWRRRLAFTRTLPALIICATQIIAIAPLSARAQSGSAWVGVSNGGSTLNSQFWGNVATSAVMKTFTGDFNGDGKADVLKIDTSYNCNGGLWVGLSTSSQFNFSRWATWCTPVDIKALVGDFNGDGRTDVMKIDRSNNCNGGLWVGLSNGVNSFDTSRWATWCTPADIEVFAGDFNGDGKTDVMKIDKSDNCNGGLWVGLSDGGVNGFSTSRWATWCTPSDIKALVGDFNGDGRTDVMKFDKSDNCSGGLWVGLSNGSNGFTTSKWATWCTPADIEVFAGDFNGDGMTDVMKIDPLYNGQRSLWAGLSTGGSFMNTPQWATWNTPHGIQALTGDFNGDGKTDVMRLDFSNNCFSGLWVGLSTGGLFNTSQWATWCTSTFIQVLAGDFDGDGDTDVMKFDVPL